MFAPTSRSNQIEIRDLYRSDTIRMISGIAGKHDAESAPRPIDLNPSINPIKVGVNILLGKSLDVAGAALGVARVVNDDYITNSNCRAKIIAGGYT